MAEIAYILLCHKDVDAVAEKAKSLTAQGDSVSIHFDGNASNQDFRRLKDVLASNNRVAFARRKRCGWGEWSLVAATLSALRASVEAFPRATHFYLLSGDCMPIKTAEYAHDFLDAHDRDYLECNDFFQSDWIKTGFRDERLIYRHWFNERSQAKLFYASYNLQKWLGLKRRVPGDLKMMIGSQWWCLRRRTVEAVLDFVAQRPDIVRFFRSTWIPDETFFQTIVPHLIPTHEIENRTLTFLMFSDYGMPVTFYNDHYDLLTAQNFLFARKISPEANELKERLGRLYNSQGIDFRISQEGQRLHAFLTRRGRFGERYAPRFWEEHSTIGRDRTLLILACKKWHVAKRLADRIAQATGIPALHYLFDEDSTSLPDLGGLQHLMAKRSRHRRAFLRVLFDHCQTNHLVICVDPANLDMICDFYSDPAETRLLEIECNYSDDYLIGHAKRVGLAGGDAPAEMLGGLIPAIRNDVTRESLRIRDERLPNFHRIAETADAEANNLSLANFLGINTAKATEIAATDHLFND